MIGLDETALADDLVSLAHVVEHVFADVAREFDLTPQQAQLLCVLIGGPVGMTELSRLLRLEKSSVTGLVDRVMRRGLVERAPDARDRRACRISLTPQGAQLAYDSHEHVTARLGELTSELQPDEHGHLAQAIARILARYAAASNGASSQR